jgi:tetratricopeptide (TPR) repeat protein
MEAENNILRNTVDDQDYGPLMSSEYSELYDDFDEIIELIEEEDKPEEAAQKFMEVTENIQKIPDEFDWDMIEIVEMIVNEFRRKNPKLAIEVLQRAVIIEPDEAPSWRRDIAEIMIYNGEVSEGISLLHKLAEEDTDDIWCWIALGRNYVDIKDYTKAEEYLKIAIELGEKQEEEYDDDEYEEDEYDDEDDDYDEDNDEDDYDDEENDDSIGTAYIHLFDVYRATDRIEEAIKAWEIASEYSDLYKFHVTKLCDMLIEKKEFQRAEQFIDEIQSSVERNYYFGKLFFMQGNEEKALYHWNAVLKKSDDRDKYIWAEVALRLGKHKLVIRELSSFLKREPRNALCKVLLSLAYAINMNMKSAKEVLNGIPYGMEMPAEYISLCEELISDRSVCNSWFDIVKQYMLMP